MWCPYCLMPSGGTNKRLAPIHSGYRMLCAGSSRTLEYICHHWYLNVEVLHINIRAQSKPYRKSLKWIPVSNLGAYGSKSQNHACCQAYNSSGQRGLILCGGFGRELVKVMGFPKGILDMPLNKIKSRMSFLKDFYGLGHFLYCTIDVIEVRFRDQVVNQRRSCHSESLHTVTIL